MTGPSGLPRATDHDRVSPLGKEQDPMSAVDPQSLRRSAARRLVHWCVSLVGSASIVAIGYLLVPRHALPHARWVRPSGAQLQNADLTWRDLAGIELDQTDLTCARLTGSNLAGATFAGSVLTGADLSYCRAEGAVFSSALLTSAKLQCANFRFVYAPYADFAGADLGG